MQDLQAFSGFHLVFLVEFDFVRFVNARKYSHRGGFWESKMQQGGFEQPSCIGEDHDIWIQQDGREKGKNNYDKFFLILDSVPE